MVDVELISPNEHFKSIYIWSNINWKLNGNWQKESCTTRDVGKIHMQLGRKGSKVIRFNLCPCKGTQRKREITQGEILCGEWAFQPTYWVPQSWGLTQETQVPFAGWRAGGINRRAEESLGSAFECPQSRAERVAETTKEKRGWPASCHCPCTCPSLSRVKVLALLASWCNSTLEQGPGCET